MEYSFSSLLVTGVSLLPYINNRLLRTEYKICNNSVLDSAWEPLEALARWFVGLSADDQVWDATVRTRNRDRLLGAAEHRVQQKISNFAPGENTAANTMAHAMDVKTAIRNRDADALRRLLTQDPLRANALDRLGDERLCPGGGKSERPRVLVIG